jgi:Sulfotransferase family
VNETGSQRAILLFGMPRSGTTWLGKIFDSHPRVLYRHEPDSWERIQIPIIASRAERSRYEAMLREYVAALPAIRVDRVCGKRPLFPKDYASPWAVRRYAVASALHRGLARIGLETAAACPPTPRSGDDYRLVWKSIESLGRLGLLIDSLPEARSVHIVRHPCGYVASVLRGEAASQFDHVCAASDLPIYEMLSRTEPARRRSLTLDVFRGMTAVERLAWRWVIFNEVAFEDTAANPRNLVLYYEELCAAPEAVTRRLFEFSGLVWNEQTAAFLRSSTARERKGYYSVFKDPLESAWHWMGGLVAPDAARIAEVAAGSVIAAPYFVENGWNRPAAGFTDRG